jgi:predicted regulator of Ras-like GTPase activity (Roadblock/LC7/MglB family)
MIDKIIKNVLELHGVEGACILDKKGVLLHNELPDFFLDDFLDDLARRILALYEAVDENYMACDDYLLKFPQKFLYLRRSRHVLLLVAVDPSVNLVSLRMVTNLVLKHVTPKVLSEMRKHLSNSALDVNIDPSLTGGSADSQGTDPAGAASKSSVSSEKPESDSEPTRDSSEPVRGRKVPRPRPTRSFRGTRY